MAIRHGVASFFATAPWLAASAGCPYQQLRHGIPASKFSRWFSAAVLPASCFRRLSVPAASPWHPGQQQTSFGGEEYSGLASNLAHLGRMRLSPGLGAAAGWQMMLQVEQGGQPLTSERRVHLPPEERCFQRSRELFRTDRGRPCPS